MAVALMQVAKVLTGSIVTQVFRVDFLTQCCVFARNLFNIAHLASPANRAIASELILLLHASGSVLARSLCAPVDEVLALFALISVSAVALVLVVLVDAGRAVLARRRIAFVDLVLTVGSGESRST